jgi:DNA-binding NarL/FixJ family response regulator
MILLCHGLQNKEIARTMGIRLETVRSGMMPAIFERLGASNRVEAALIYVREHPELLHT